MEQVKKYWNDILRKLKQTETMHKVFYLASSLAFCVFSLLTALTHFAAARLYFYKGGSSFYDFFYCLRFGNYLDRYHLYETHTIYPPLANAIYCIMSRFMSTKAIRSMADFKNPAEIITISEAAILYTIYFIVTLLLFVAVTKSLKKGSKFEKTAFTVLILFSVPFMYQFERANIIFVALIFSMLFLLWKDSENAVLREASFVSLSVAAGIKLYPAILGLILVKEKRWKEAIRTMVYGVLAFVLPFKMFGGIRTGIKAMFGNMFGTIETFDVKGPGYHLNYTAFFKALLEGNATISNFVSGGIVTLLLGLGIIAFFGLKKDWKGLLLLSCLILGVPSISYTYAGIFLVMPLIFLLDATKDRKKTDYIYLIGILLVMLPLPFDLKASMQNVYYGFMEVPVSMYLACGAVFGMTVLLIIEGMAGIVREQKKAVVAAVAAVTLLIAVFAGWRGYGKINEPYSYTNYMTKINTGKETMSDGAVMTQEFTTKKATLNSFYLRFTGGKEGSYKISLKDAENKEVLYTEELMVKDVVNGQNHRFDTANMPVEANRDYVVEVEAHGTTDNSKIYITEENVVPKDEVATYQGQKMKYAMGLLVFER
ncbi:MAG: DUF2029 domain-containing protein [Lachnospiraceae bacterium]|nr:DUF2029 domain-containing protein [Lachnospiraceae bacterium]